MWREAAGPAGARILVGSELTANATPAGTCGLLVATYVGGTDAMKQSATLRRAAIALPRIVATRRARFR